MKAGFNPNRAAATAKIAGAPLAKGPLNSPGLKEGLSDLPGRIEIYDRAHVYDAKFLAGRFKTLVDEYRAEQGK